jgi:SEC-C motif
MAERNIPLQIKRTLRQQAGFGCCVCGHPFIEYHHIRQFADLPQHLVEDMMVLCPIHHHQATVGALSTAEQREAKEQPFNLREGFVNGQLVGTPNQLAVSVGSVQFVGAGFKVVVDEESLLEIRADVTGRLLLSLSLYDEDDKLLFVLRDNEWISGDPLPWDFEYSYNLIRLRRGDRDVRLLLDARHELVEITGVLCFAGQRFDLRPDILRVNGVISDVGFSNLCLVANHLQANTKDKTFTIVPDSRLGAGMFVSWPDVHERVKRGLDAYRQLIHDAHVGRNELCPCGSGKKAKRCDHNIRP